jgi:hypothetical protein
VPAGGRRNLMSQPGMMSNPKFSQGGLPQAGSETIDQIKRKKLRREMIFGSKQQTHPTQNYFVKMQKEDL